MTHYTSSVQGSHTKGWVDATCFSALTKGAVTLVQTKLGVGGVLVLSGGGWRGLFDGHRDYVNLERIFLIPTLRRL